MIFFIIFFIFAGKAQIICGEIFLDFSFKSRTD
jgi:hypothetical protein